MYMATDTITETIQFQLGKSYECRSISNHEVVYRFTVTARSARFVTFTDRWGDVRRVGVSVSNGSEWACPHGKHANCAVVRASRPAED